MDRVQIEAFTYEAGIDYLPYYKKLSFQYDDKHTLRDLLLFLTQEISNYACDMERIALRINGIAVFENLPLLELAQYFGDCWEIEPLSIYYAKKDLLLDKSAMLKRYDEFFAWADFLSFEEREELHKYLLLNLITPLSLDNTHETYLGDGFFLYVKWILSRHPDKIKEIREYIIKPKEGILNFVSLAQWVYPRAYGLDEEIWEMMRDVIFSGDARFYQALLKG